jgi:hemerythrin-like domain-containing protein
METSPIKRSKYILPLSREHHFTLLFSWKIRQGLKNNIDTDRIIKYVDYFWQQHMREHFRQEEELLFNKIKDEFTMKAVADHEQIREMIQRLQVTVSKQTLLAELAEVVDDHVRFEERTLFPHLEKNIPEAVLQNIEKDLCDDPIKTDDFNDVFWK